MNFFSITSAKEVVKFVNKPGIAEKLFSLADVQGGDDRLANKKIDLEEALLLTNPDN